MSLMDIEQEFIASIERQWVANDDDDGDDQSSAWLKKLPAVVSTFLIIGEIILLLTPQKFVDSIFCGNQ